MPRGFFNFPRHWVDRIEIGETDDCWCWRGAHDGKGYPRSRIKAGNGATKRVHRLIAELFHGTAGRVVHHKCENPGCVNPGHLEVMETNGEHTSLHSRKCQHTDDERGPSKTSCRVCKKEWYWKNVERQREIGRASYWRHVEKRRSQMREYQRLRRLRDA